MSVATVAAIIPSYNHAPYVGEAVTSALGQTFDDIEVIVADDGSTDTSLEILRELEATDERLRVVQHQGGVNRGRIPTLKLAVACSTAPYLAFLASDDRWRRDRLARQVPALRDGAPLSFGRVAFIDLQGQPAAWPDALARLDLPHLLDLLFVENPISAPTVTITKTAYDRAGGFSDDQAYEDIDLWLRCVAQGPAHFVDEVIADYRINPRGARAQILAEGDDLRAYGAAVRNLAGWPNLPADLEAKAHRYDEAWRRLDDLLYGDAATSLVGASDDQLDALARVMRSRRRTVILLLARDPQRWRTARRASPGAAWRLQRAVPAIARPRLAALALSLYRARGTGGR
jgi:glycosyltransferase involved in cell wall biosynthesis